MSWGSDDTFHGVDKGSMKNPIASAAAGNKARRPALQPLSMAEPKPYKMSSKVVQAWLDADEPPSPTPTYDSFTIDGGIEDDASGNATARKRKASELGADATATHAKKHRPTLHGTRKIGDDPALSWSMSLGLTNAMATEIQYDQFAAMAQSMACSVQCRQQKRMASDWEEMGMEMGGIFKRQRIGVY